MVQPRLPSRSSCYTNNVHNKDGGTHLTGLRSALTRLLNNYGQANNLFKDVKNGLTGDDCREGIICVIHVKHPDASFDSQTKSKLVSSEVKGIVETAVVEQIGRYFEEHPTTARKIIDKAILAAKAREAARKAREVVRKGVMDTTSLSGKLADCQSRIPASPSFTSSRVTRPGAVPSRARSAFCRPFCLCAGRF